MSVTDESVIRDVVSDPRFEARRHEVSRARRRRHRRVLLLVAGLAVTVGGVFAAAGSGLLDVDRIVVEGSSRATVEAIEEGSGVSIGDRMLTLDVGAIDRRLEAVPWVDEVRVTRRWPGTLRIEVSERQPVAMATFGGETALLSGDGRVEEVGPIDAISDASDLVEITGIRMLPAPGEYLYPQGVASLTDELPAPLAERVAAVDLERPDDVVLVLDDGPEVRLGGLTDLEAKGEVAWAVIERLAADEEFATYVDVSVAANPVAGVGPVEVGPLDSTTLTEIPSLAQPPSR